MNFELSLPLLWLVFFDLVGAIIFFQTKPKLNFSKIWPWLLFPGFLTLSAFWSLNPLRGLLTVAVLWLIYLAIFNFFALKKTVHFFPNFVRNFWRIFFASSLLVCAWCWVQCLLDLAGLPQSATLMCDGCIYQMFGFPHPDGFAIEPQFMGNLLLAPTFLAAWFIFAFSSKKEHTGSKKQEKVLLASLKTESTPPIKSTFARYLIFFILTATLFLTFSRGAIYAFIVGLIALTIWRIVQTASARPLLSWLIVIFAFLFTFNAQGIMAELGPTSDTYPTAVSKVIEQLSLGLIDPNFSDPTPTPEPTSTVEVPINPTPDTSSTFNANPIPDIETQNTPVFEGYVAESTDTRLRLTSSALQIWQSSPSIMVFGVGLGGAGQALYDANLSPAPKEIVQNQYASLLLETGLLGCLLAAFTFYLILRHLNNSSLRLPLFALVLAYAVTLCFFSGLPNALQIYLIPPLLLLISKM